MRAGFYTKGRFLYKGKTVEKFVNKQLALANDFNAAWKLSDYQIKNKYEEQTQVGIEKARK